MRMEVVEPDATVNATACGPCRASLSSLELKIGSALSARAHVTHQFAVFCKVMATKYRILDAFR
jgi:hypothetical protein